MDFIYTLKKAYFSYSLAFFFNNSYEHVDTTGPCNLMEGCLLPTEAQCLRRGKWEVWMQTISQWCLPAPGEPEPSKPGLLVDLAFAGAALGGGVGVAALHGA